MKLFGKEFTFNGNKVYHAGNKPSKSDIGLGAVNNWGASSSISANSTSQYATTNMVAQVRAEKANASHTHNYAGASSAGGAANSALTCSGNSETATVLKTARTINGTSFNGSGNITTANWGTARNLKIGNTSKSVNGSSNISWSLAEIGAAAEENGTQRWKSIIKCSTWSRIVHIKPSDYLGCSILLSIQGTRPDVLYNRNFIINTSHDKLATIEQLNSTDYNNCDFQIRAVVNGAGEVYIEIYDDAKGVTNAKTQDIYVSLINLTSNNNSTVITKYTSFQDGSVIPSSYKEAHKIISSHKSKFVKGEDKILGDGEDWNNYVYNGIYLVCINNDKWGANCPNNSYPYGNLLVLRSSSNVVTQVYFPHSDITYFQYRTRWETDQRWTNWINIGNWGYAVTNEMDSILKESEVKSIIEQLERQKEVNKELYEKISILEEIINQK